MRQWFRKLRYLIRFWIFGYVALVKTTQNKVFTANNSTSVLQVLHLSNLQITNFPGNFTSYFPFLDTLNISGNFLGEFPKFSFAGLGSVYLSGLSLYNQFTLIFALTQQLANKWNCSNSLEWALEVPRQVFKDIEQLRCFRMPHNNKPVMAIAQFRKVF